MALNFNSAPSYYWLYTWVMANIIEWFSHFKKGLMVTVLSYIVYACLKGNLPVSWDA